MMTREMKIKALQAIASGALKRTDTLVQQHIVVGQAGSWQCNGLVLTDEELAAFRERIEAINKRRAACNLPLDTVVIIEEQT